MGLWNFVCLPDLLEDGGVSVSLNCTIDISFSLMCYFLKGISLFLPLQTGCKNKQKRESEKVSTGLECRMFVQEVCRFFYVHTVKVCRWRKQEILLELLQVLLLNYYFVVAAGYL